MSIAVERIKAILEERDISIRKLGVLTGIPPATISRYVGTESQKIPLDKLELIANALNVPPSHLMGWEDGNVYHCPDDENPWILKICEIMESSEIDTQIAICRKAESIIRGEEEPEELTEQERALLRLFRDTTEEGRMRMIQSVLNIHDAAVKSSDAAGDTRLA